MFEELASRLSLKRCSPASADDLRQIEIEAGVSLPDDFKQFYLEIGECIANARLSSGPFAGQPVADFWSAERIRQELAEDPESGVIPFASDPFGNWISLMPGAGPEVRLMDWNTERLDVIAKSFAQFLRDLRAHD